MSIILSSEDDNDLKVNAWNWGVLHHLVNCAGVFPDDFWEPKRGNLGGALEQEDINTLADFLEGRVLPQLKPGQRMYFDGSITEEPDDGTFYREEDELWRNYSLHHSVLVKVIEFLRSSKPPVDIL